MKEDNDVVNVYVDGSSLEHEGVIHVGWAYVIEMPDGSQVSDYNNDVAEGFKPQRNIAGECTAVMRALAKLKELELRRVIIHHDFEGLPKWPNGQWKAKNPYTQAYADTVNNSGIDITWNWIPGHSGNPGNEQVDKLAYAAVKGGHATEYSIDTGNYWQTHNTGAVPIVISVTKPKNSVDSRNTHLKCIPALKPDKVTLDLLKDQVIDEAEYTRRYLERLDVFIAKWPGETRAEKLRSLLIKACEMLGSKHIVLLCWEKEGAFCHRRIIYNELPDDIKGVCR